MLNQFEYTSSFLKELFELNLHLTDDMLKCQREKKYEIKDTYQSYRTINYWDSMGLLDDGRNKQSKGWRKFSAFDLAFIAIITYLRQTGFPIDKIKEVKRVLYSKWEMPNEKTFKNKLAVIEFVYYRALALKGAGNTYLLVDLDGSVRFTTSNNLHYNLVEGNLPTLYIVINLNKLFKEFFKNHFEEQKEKHFANISDDEIEVIWNLRDANVNQVMVTKQNNKITNIDKVYKGKKDDFPELHELIGNTKYGNINLRLVDGKVSGIEVVDKEKL